MKQRRRLALARLVLAAVVLACDGQLPPPVDKTDHASDPARVPTPLVAETLHAGGALTVDHTPFLRVSGTRSDTSDFHRIAAALIVSDDRVIVVDAGPRVRLFAGGREVSAIGRAGEGPGEYQAISVLSAFGTDSIFIFDPRLMRASVFDLAGNFARSFVLASRRGETTEALPVALGVFDDGTILSGARQFLPGEQGRTGVLRPNLLLMRHDRTGAALDSIGYIAGDQVAVSAGILMRFPFLRRTLIAVGGDEFYSTTNDSLLVALRSSSGRLVRVVRESTPLRVVTAAELAPLQRSGITLPSRVTHPAIETLFRDAVGRVWIQTTADQGKTGDWFVHDATGKRLGMVAMPSRFRPLHATRSAVIGIWQDTTDVEFIRGYRLRSN